MQQTEIIKTLDTLAILGEWLIGQKTIFFRRVILIMTFVLLLASSTLLAKSYYVSPTGADTQTGTRALPFRTIQHSADIMQPGDTCQIRKGLYEESVRPKMSGTASSPIVFKAYEGENVTISGSNPITGWIHENGDIYSVRRFSDLGRNNQLFFDGKMVDEARWPNRNNEDLFNVNGADIETGGDGYIICNALPDLPDNAWNGAVLWAMAGSKWTSWTSIVSGYQALEKKLSFKMPKEGTAKYMNPKNGGIFYLTGIKEALDAPNEWYFDQKAQTLYFWAPGGVDPNLHQVTAKQRMLAFDLSNRSYIHVAGLSIHAATIDMDGAEYCMVERIRATYISHTRGGETDSDLKEKSGIYVSGFGNTIRDSEIAYSVGSGVSLNGTGQRLINCWVHHTAYIGNSASGAVSFSGNKHLVSHNTINDSGRDLIKYTGVENIIQYNNLYRCGLLAEDLGFTYSFATDGANTEFHHNWVHDNMATHIYSSAGIYFDNFTSNYLVHHNVIWGVTGRSLQLNRPSNGISAFNNTIIGRIGHWGRWKDDDRMYGDLLANNLVTDSIDMHRDMKLSHNLIGIPETNLNSNNFQDNTRPGRHQGRIIQGITDGYTGVAPDIGAYIEGQEPWVPGHNFTKHPEPEYKLTLTPYKNLLNNAGFELGDLEGWKRIGERQAVKLNCGTDITSPPNSRNSIIGSSACLQAVGDDGLEQTVINLVPNTRYVFAGYTKVSDGGEIRLGIKDYGGQEQSEVITEKEWIHRQIEFTTGANNTSVTVFVSKQGEGVGYADWLLLRQVF